MNLSNVWKGMSTGILAQGWEEREKEKILKIEGIRKRKSWIDRKIDR